MDILGDDNILGLFSDLMNVSWQEDTPQEQVGENGSSDSDGIFAGFDSEKVEEKDIDTSEIGFIGMFSDLVDNDEVEENTNSHAQEVFESEPSEGEVFAMFAEFSDDVPNEEVIKEPPPRVDVSFVGVFADLADEEEDIHTAPIHTEVLSSHTNGFVKMFAEFDVNDSQEAESKGSVSVSDGFLGMFAHYDDDGKHDEEIDEQTLAQSRLSAASQSTFQDTLPIDNTAAVAVDSRKALCNTLFQQSDYQACLSACLQTLGIPSDFLPLFLPYQIPNTPPLEVAGLMYREIWDTAVRCCLSLRSGDASLKLLNKWVSDCSLDEKCNLSSSRTYPWGLFADTYKLLEDMTKEVYCLYHVLKTCPSEFQRWGRLGRNLAHFYTFNYIENEHVFILSIVLCYGQGLFWLDQWCKKCAQELEFDQLIREWKEEEKNWKDKLKFHSNFNSHSIQTPDGTGEYEESAGIEGMVASIALLADSKRENKT